VPVGDRDARFERLDGEALPFERCHRAANLEPRRRGECRLFIEQTIRDAFPVPLRTLAEAFAQQHFQQQPDAAFGAGRVSQLTDRSRELGLDLRLIDVACCRRTALNVADAVCGLDGNLGPFLSNRAELLRGTPKEAIEALPGCDTICAEGCALRRRLRALRRTSSATQKSRRAVVTSGDRYPAMASATPRGEGRHATFASRGALTRIRGRRGYSHT